MEKIDLRSAGLSLSFEICVGLRREGLAQSHSAWFSLPSDQAAELWYWPSFPSTVRMSQAARCLDPRTQECYKMVESGVQSNMIYSRKSDLWEKLTIDRKQHILAMAKRFLVAMLGMNPNLSGETKVVVAKMVRMLGNNEKWQQTVWEEWDKCSSKVRSSSETAVRRTAFHQWAITRPNTPLVTVW